MDSWITLSRSFAVIVPRWRVFTKDAQISLIPQARCSQRYTVRSLTRGEYLDRKEHWTQITPEMVTREFATLREKYGACDHLRAEQHPTFHEIRALGGELYRQAGWGNEAIQRLLGHTTEKMTRHYLDKHQEPWVVTDVVGLPDRVCRKDFIMTAWAK
jgi:integrase